MKEARPQGDTCEAFGGGSLVIWIYLTLFSRDTGTTMIREPQWYENHGGDSDTGLTTPTPAADRPYPAGGRCGQRDEGTTSSAPRSWQRKRGIRLKLNEPFLYRPTEPNRYQEWIVAKNTTGDITNYCCKLDYKKVISDYLSNQHDIQSQDVNQQGIIRE